jgi:hypothetical protein
MEEEKEDHMRIEEKSSGSLGRRALRIRTVVALGS